MSNGPFTIFFFQIFQLVRMDKLHFLNCNFLFDFESPNSLVFSLI